MPDTRTPKHKTPDPKQHNHVLTKVTVMNALIAIEP